MATRLPSWASKGGAPKAKAETAVELVADDTDAERAARQKRNAKGMAEAVAHIAGLKAAVAVEAARPKSLGEQIDAARAAIAAGNVVTDHDRRLANASPAALATARERGAAIVADARKAGVVK